MLRRWHNDTLKWVTNHRANEVNMPPLQDSEADVSRFSLLSRLNYQFLLLRQKYVVITKFKSTQHIIKNPTCFYYSFLDVKTPQG